MFIVSRFGPTIRVCLQQIIGYKELLAEVEQLRKTPYDSSNKQHEDLLYQVQNAPNTDSNYTTHSTHYNLYRSISHLTLCITSHNTAHGVSIS